MVIVANKSRCSVVSFSRDWAPLWVLGVYGSGVGQFTAPSGVAVDGCGNILVRDVGNKRIVVLGIDGSWRHAFPAPKGTQWLHVDDGGHVFVSVSTFWSQSSNSVVMLLGTA